MAKDTKPRGPASTYDETRAAEICEKLANGIPLAVICREDGMPAVRTVSDWKAANEKFAADFARAREDGADALAAQCLEIAHNEEHDWIMTKKGPILNETAVGRARLQVDTHLKLLAKWFPKRYGEKLDLNANVTGDLKITIGGDVG